MGTPQGLHGDSMGTPWTPWGLHGDSTGTPRGLHGDSTGTPRGLHGDSTRTPRGLHAFQYLVILHSLPYIPPYSDLYLIPCKLRWRKDLGGAAHKLKLLSKITLSGLQLRLWLWPDLVTTPSVEINSTRIHNTAPPQVPTKHTPTTIVHGLCDLSVLHLDAPNPWGTLCHCYYHCYSHTPWQFGSAKQGRFPHLYPTNTPIHKHPVLKFTPSSPLHIFETVKHLQGIGTNKPIIWVPVSIAANAPTHHVVHECAIVKAAPPLPHQTATLWCECGQVHLCSALILILIFHTSSNLPFSFF